MDWILDLGLGLKHMETMWAKRGEYLRSRGVFFWGGVGAEVFLGGLVLGLVDCVVFMVMFVLR